MTSSLFGVTWQSFIGRKKRMPAALAALVDEMSEIAATLHDWAFFSVPSAAGVHMAKLPSSMVSERRNHVTSLTRAFLGTHDGRQQGPREHHLNDHMIVVPVIVCKSKSALVSGST